MLINANTKISAILKHHPDALEAIISINPIFNKLRNPILRKLMSGRTSLLMASKVGGCSVDDFFEKLKPLGFVAEKAAVDENLQQPISKPAFISQASPAQVVALDVRPMIETGEDPFKIIMGKIKTLQPGMVLKLINSFEPAPLIEILQKKGFEYYVENVDANQVITYFHNTNSEQTIVDEQIHSSEDWDSVIKNFQGKTITIDVRQLQMPGPMMTILESLNELPTGYALFVNHKRIPVFLLPELKERNFDYRIKTIAEGEVNILIFKA